MFTSITLTTTVQTVIWLKTTKDSEIEVNYSYYLNYDFAASKDSSSDVLNTAEIRFWVQNIFAKTKQEGEKSSNTTFSSKQPYLVIKN
jgi:hypothetical protein